MIKDYEEKLEESEMKHFTGKTIVIAVLVTLALAVALLIVGCDEAHAYTDEEAVKCILGEARGEGYDSMLAHAEAIRNRGHLKGVYGCKADYSKEMPYLIKKGIIKEAILAWEQSQWTNTVHKAQFWGSVIVDKDWIKTMEKAGYVKTATIKNTSFYRKP